MKFLITILFFTTLNLFSQDRNDDNVMGRFDDNKKEIHKSALSIKIDVLTPIVNQIFYNRPTVCLSLEYGFSRRHAFQLTGQYGTFFQKNYAVSMQLVNNHGPYVNWLTDLFQTRAEMILDYKYYWKDSNDFKGVYCGLYIRGIEYNTKFRTAKGTNGLENVALDYIGYGCGATVGYQIFFKTHLTFDFLFGLGVRNVFFNPKPNYGITYISSQADIPPPLQTLLGIDIRTTINIGYKF